MYRLGRYSRNALFPSTRKISSLSSTTSSQAAAAVNLKTSSFIASDSMGGLSSPSPSSPLPLWSKCWLGASVAGILASGPSVVFAATDSGIAESATVAASVSPAIASLLAILPPLCFLFLQTSPLATMNVIKEANSSDAFSGVPFVSLFTNCVVWVMYGVMKMDMTVLAPNTSALCFGAYYMYTYHKYSSADLSKYYMASAAVVLPALCMPVVLPPDQAIANLGLMGCAMAVFFMSSPLAVMKEVIQTKSTNALPLLTSVATFCNASSWAAYGFLVANDPYIYYPNTMGLVASCVQLSLFGIYGMPQKLKAPDAKN